jgi:LEA14-like dessication related protein
MEKCGHGVVLAALIVLSVAACNRVDAPEVELTGVRFAGMGLQGISLIADLSIENPNDFAIEADSITFKLESGNLHRPGTWTQVTSGTDRARLRVEGGGRTTTAVPIEFAYADLTGPVRSAAAKGMLDYRVSGHVWVRKPLPIPVPFSHTGKLSLAGH